MTELLLNNLDFLTPELAAAISTTLLALAYYVATAVIHYLDNAYEGKQESRLLNIVLFLVKKVLARIEPGKVGRRIAAKKNPDSVTAMRSDKDKTDWNVF